MTSGMANKKFLNRFLSDVSRAVDGIGTVHGELDRKSTVTTTRIVDKKRLVGLSFLAVMLLTSGSIDAKATLEKPEAFQKKLQKAAGPLGPFAQEEAFPKSYFLVPFNLPYLVGLTLYHPKSSLLDLSDEQIRRIEEVCKRTVPTVLKKASEIKRLEMALAEEVWPHKNQQPFHNTKKVESLLPPKMDKA